MNAYDIIEATLSLPNSRLLSYHPCSLPLLLPLFSSTIKSMEEEEDPEDRTRDLRTRGSTKVRRVDLLEWDGRRRGGVDKMRQFESAAATRNLSLGMELGPFYYY